MTNSKCPSCVIQHDKTVMRYDFNKFNQRNIYLRFYITKSETHPRIQPGPGQGRGKRGEEGGEEEVVFW